MISSGDVMFAECLSLTNALTGEIPGLRSYGVAGRWHATSAFEYFCHDDGV